MGSEWMEQLAKDNAKRDKAEASERDASRQRSQKLQEDAGLNWQRIAKCMQTGVDRFNTKFGQQTELKIRPEADNTLVVVAVVRGGQVEVRVHLPSHGRHLCVERSFRSVFEERPVSKLHFKLLEDLHEQLRYWDEDQEKYVGWNEVSKQVFSVFVEAMGLTPQEP